MSYEADSRDIAEALIAIGGVGFRLEEPIMFKSGIVSPVYCDNRQFPFWPAQWSKVIRGFERMIADRGIAMDVVGGVEAAGIPHSAALGFAMQKPSIFIRKVPKEHGTRKRVEGGDVRGRSVVLVEDLVTTGGSSIAAIEALRAEGAEVSDCLTIISYGFAEAKQLFEKHKVQLHAATTFETVLEVATRRGLIAQENVQTVREWVKAPYSWANKYGFEANGEK
jgi:orotate phosphoribosyltransferase